MTLISADQWQLPSLTRYGTMWLAGEQDNRPPLAAEGWTQLLPIWFYTIPAWKMSKRPSWDFLTNSELATTVRELLWGRQKRMARPIAFDKKKASQETPYRLGKGD